MLGAVKRPYDTSNIAARLANEIYCGEAGVFCHMLGIYQYELRPEEHHAQNMFPDDELLIDGPLREEMGLRKALKDAGIASGDASAKELVRQFKANVKAILKEAYRQ